MPVYCTRTSLAIRIFSINYGLVEYVDWDKHQSNAVRFANPVQYTYIKDAINYHDERELRVSLSALGIGHFVLDDGSNIEFQESLEVEFNFRTTIRTGAIQQLISSPDCDSSFVQQELDKCGIGVAQHANVALPRLSTPPLPNRSYADAWADDAAGPDPAHAIRTNGRRERAKR
jgi:hypothetical protein